MLLTVEEALKSPCPLTLMNAHMGYCMAHKCKMAWRWGEPPDEICEDHDDPETAKRRIAGGWSKGILHYPYNGTAEWHRPNPHRRGYCGLAGRPEEG